MPEANDIEARLTAVETTQASLVPDLRKFMHDMYDVGDRVSKTVAEMKAAHDKEEKWSRKPDVFARSIAVAAMIVAIALHFNRSNVSQNQDVNVDSKPSEAELHDQRVRDFLNRNTGESNAPDQLPGTADGDPSPASGDR